MRMPRVLTAMVLAGGLAGTVQADTLISGPVYGGPDQTKAACVLVNAGTAAITFTTKEFLSDFRRIDPDFDNCGTALGAGHTCNFQGPSVGQAAACKISTLELKTNVRGTMVGLDYVNNIWLNQSDLR
jgi:hypothetical protein